MTSVVFCTFSSSQRRGGAKRRGGQFGEIEGCRSDHPVCAAAVASHHLFGGAATPPLRGGEWGSAEPKITLITKHDISVDRT